jgi:hypothetical protein
MEPTYSIKEIMELQFKGIDHKLDSIVMTLKDQNIQTEKRFAQIEKDIDELRVESAKYKTIWGIGATVGASFIAYLANRIF